MAAGPGSRLRPLTERWPKPVLPIDGRPVVVTLVHELAAAGCSVLTVVNAAGDADGAIAVHGSFRPPLWLLGARLARFLEPLPGKPPYELGHVFDNAVAAGVTVSAVEVGATRDLTTPDDLVRENFGYLR